MTNRFVTLTLCTTLFANFGVSAQGLDSQYKTKGSTQAISGKFRAVQPGESTKANLKAAGSKALPASLHLQTEGGVATGGGEYISQEIQHLVASMPAAISSYGRQYFPEVDFSKLQDISRAKLAIQIENNIVVNGAPKVLRFDIDKQMIFVDADKWQELSRKPDS
jgi:hypothetical protein